MRDFLARFGIPLVIISLSAFVTAAIVSFLWSLARHGTGVVDWEAAVRLAVILGIVVPLSRAVAGRSTQT